MSKPKVSPGGLVLSTTVPIEQWGRDHWSALAFIEYLCVDHHGVLDEKRRRNLRCNPKTHPGYGSNESAVFGWKPLYGSRLLGYYNGTQVVKVRQLPDHDDWDCMEDMEAAGLVENSGSGMNPVFKLTELGLKLAAQIRAHKANGGQFATFQPKYELA